jgi:hypothetical protein
LPRHLPVVFIERENHAAIARVENHLREGLKPLQEADALKQLMDERAYKEDKLARTLL